MSSVVHSPSLGSAHMPKFIGAVQDEWQLYSDSSSDYTIGPPIGFGASSIVYSSTFRPVSDPSGEPIPCALKVLDLDSLPQRSLQLLQRETTLMSLSKHPNVLRVRGSWVHGHKLYIALRLMNKGSAADVIRYGWPGGMEEDVVRCILAQALKGLNYLHVNGFIHRDIKAANLLIDDDGTVLLGDLGVAADLSEDSSHIRTSPSSLKPTDTDKIPLSNSNPFSLSSIYGEKKSVTFNAVSPATHKPTIGKRKSFVGTPCWMAPELIQGKQYDSSADIWSFGITALELTQGRPPKSRESPQQVLLKTIQEEPPTLNRDGGVHKYSREFKDTVDRCLAKDPAKRPTAEELLQTPFFSGAKKKNYLIKKILKDLPPLTQRQERHVLPSLLSANSIDSWDFASTANSPTTSVMRRRTLEEVSIDNEELKSCGIFAIEEDGRIPASPRRNASLGEEHVVEETELETESVEPESIISPSLSASDSSGVSTTSDPSSIVDTTASSSFVDAPDITSKLKESAAEPSSVGAPIADSRTVVGLNSVLSESASPATPRANQDSRSNFSPSPSHNIWHRIKNNVAKRPSTHFDLEEDNSGGSPRKEKDKGNKINGILASASKGLLSRSSTRSFATPSTDC